MFLFAIPRTDDFHLTQTFVLISLEFCYVVNHFALDLQVLNIIITSLMHRTT